LTEVIVEPTPQSLAKPKVVVCKTLIDPTMAKLTGEKLKSAVFVKFGFLRPPSWQIQQKSVDKDYDVYVVVDGRYMVDYYRKRNYTVNVDGKVQEIVIFDQTLKPEPTADPNKKSVVLEGLERMFRESKACVILDAKGREVSPKRIPSAPSEENPEAVLAKFAKTKPLESPPYNELDILRSKIVKRPSEMERVSQETFEIMDHAVMYVPVYKLKFQNLNTGEERTLKIDGVTGKLIH